jgi:hypothetical protein
MGSMRNSEAPVVAVLVNYNGADDTLQTVASLRRAAAGDLRLVVVDNGSTDDSATRLDSALSGDPGVELLRSGDNLGFAGGNDLGLERALEHSDAGWLLLLNTDVEVDGGFLAPLIEACLDPSVGAAGPKIFFAEPPDRLWAAGGRLRLRETVTEEFGRGESDGPRFSRPRDVTYLTTCCLLVPRDALLRVGLLDPLYFLNVDDADWCRRASAAGYRLRYVPESRIWHEVAASTAGGYTPLKTFHTGRSNTLFVRRHHRWPGLLAFLAANLVALPGAWLRELPRGNTAAVVAKMRGILRGLADPLGEPPMAGRA